MATTAIQKPINISLSDAIDYATNYALKLKQPPVPEDQKALVFRVSKFNNTVTAFNISSVLIIAALAAALFVSLQAAVVLGAIGICARIALQKELNNMTDPADAQLALEQWFIRLTGRAQGSADHVFQQLGIPKVAGWTPALVTVFGQEVWKRQVPMAT